MGVVRLKIICAALALPAVASAEPAGLSGLYFGGGAGGGVGVVVVAYAGASFKITRAICLGPEVGLAFVGGGGPYYGGTARYYFAADRDRTVRPLLTAGAAYVDTIEWEYSAPNGTLVFLGGGLDFDARDHSDALYVGATAVGHYDGSEWYPAATLQVGSRIGAW